MIEWKEGAVCSAGGWQFRVWDCVRSELITTDNKSIFDFETCLSFKDFQLNEIREWDYIETSELDTEQKYNDAVEVFRLFGFEWSSDFKWAYFRSSTHMQIYIGENRLLLGFRGKRKITYPQLMAIGKLKRAMIDRDEVERVKLKRSVIFSEDEIYAIISGKSVDTASAGRRNKSKQAYDILKSLDYEYDLNKQKWYKKEWV